MKIPTNLQLPHPYPGDSFVVIEGADNRVHCAVWGADWQAVKRSLYRACEIQGLDHNLVQELTLKNTNEIHPIFNGEIV